MIRAVERGWLAKALELGHDLSDFCRPVLRQDGWQQQLLQPSGWFRVLQEPPSPRTPVNPRLAQQCKAQLDLRNTYWAMDVFYHHNTNYLVYSVIGALARINSAVRLRYFCWGSLEQSITTYMIMDGFNQGVTEFVLEFLPVLPVSNPI